MVTTYLRLYDLVTNYLFQGDLDLSTWVIQFEVSPVPLTLVTSKKQGLINLPMRGWRYWDGTMMQDDDTLTVTGKYIGCMTVAL